MATIRPQDVPAFFAAFDGPARAVRCAGTVVAGLREQRAESKAQTEALLRLIDEPGEAS